MPIADTLPDSRRDGDMLAPTTTRPVSKRLTSRCRSSWLYLLEVVSPARSRFSKKDPGSTPLLRPQTLVQGCHALKQGSHPPQASGTSGPEILRVLFPQEGLGWAGRPNYVIPLHPSRAPPAPLVAMLLIAALDIDLGLWGPGRPCVRFLHPGSEGSARMGSPPGG